MKLEIQSLNGRRNGSKAKAINDGEIPAKISSAGFAMLRTGPGANCPTKMAASKPGHRHDQGRGDFNGKGAVENGKDAKAMAGLCRIGRAERNPKKEITQPMDGALPIAQLENRERCGCVGRWRICAGQI